MGKDDCEDEDQEQQKVLWVFLFLVVLFSLRFDIEQKLSAGVSFWLTTGGRCRTLFSRALAELKYMGMIKNSRKKADHVAKLLWKGL